MHVRRDRKNRLYFQWPRGEPSDGGARGGYEKVASKWVYPSKPTAQTSMKKTAAEVAERIGLALKDGSSPEVIKALAMGTALPVVVMPSSHGDASEPAPVDPAASVHPTALPLGAVLEVAIGKSARHIKPREKLARIAHWREHPPSDIGIYQSWTQQARTARQLADQIEDMLGADTDLLSLTENHVQKLWKAGVADNALKRVSVLLRVSNWAARHYRVSHGYTPLTLAPRWQSRIAKSARPRNRRRAKAKRYTPQEMGRIWKVLTDRSSPVHPAVRFAALVAGEQRLGQVLNTTVEDVVRVGGVFLVKPPEDGNKKTSWVRIDRTYLPEFLALYVAAKKRPDQKLFPLTRTPALKAWKKLETLAATSHHGWYGMRRTMTHFCDEALTALVRDREIPLKLSSAVVLDAITGHMPPGEREGVYRDSPVGVEEAPEAGSGMLDVITSAMRVVHLARALAIQGAKMRAGAGC